jgi:hypothetical protein
MLIEFPESVGYEDETHGYPRAPAGVADGSPAYPHGQP